MTLVVALGIGLGRPGVVSAASRYDHFLFVRHDMIEGQSGGTDTLVMAKVMPGGFQQKALYSRNNLGIGLEFLGVFGGQAYVMKIDQPCRLDLATGRYVRVTERTQSHDYVDGRLFTLEGGSAIREYDLRAGAYREVMTIPDPGMGGLRASPDGKRLAFFTQVPSDATYADQLNAVDVETGTVRPVGKPVRFSQWAISSTLGIGPPFVWLDEKTILLVRTEGLGHPDASGRVGYKPGDVIDRLAAINIETGEMRDVAVIPGQPGLHRIEMSKPTAGSPPILDVEQTRYAVDVPAGKLVESDGIGGDFRLREARRSDGEGYQELYHDTRLLSAATGHIWALVSPDGKRVIWKEGWPVKLRYYDPQDGEERAVAEVWTGGDGRSLLWFSGEDLRAGGPVQPPAGWRAFEESEYPEPRPPDTRKDVNDVLAFTVSCDKASYRLHEPVQVSMTIANRSGSDLEVARPRFDWRVVGHAVLQGPKSKGLDFSWGSDEIHPMEMISLKPGLSVSGTETIEVARPGCYTLEVEFNANQQTIEPPTDFRGRLNASPVAFEVRSSPDDSSLLPRKMERLFSQLRDQQAKDPRWDGWLPAGDDILEVGPEGAAYLMRAIPEEHEATVVRRLYAALADLATPEALPFYQQDLRGADDEQKKLAVKGLYDLCARGTSARQEALRSLLGALAGEHSESVRPAAVDCLVRLRDPAVRDAFKRMVADGEQVVSPRAARYLAAYGGLTLEKWFAVAAKEPTQARFVSARFIIEDLQRHWHITRGDLAGLSWKGVSTDERELAQFRKALLGWEQWARENPRASATFFDRYRTGWTGP
jgi:hypothetical protein